MWAMSKTGNSRHDYHAEAPPPVPATGGTVSEQQRYYWSREWQADERESVEALDRGEGVIFEGADEAIRWLTDEAAETRAASVR
jgi:hypothetical protein